MVGTLRQLRAADVPMLIQIRTSPLMQQELAAEFFSPSYQDALDWIERASTAAHRGFFVIQETESETAVGFLQIFDFRSQATCCRIGLAIHPDFQGRGLGSEALRESLVLVRAAEIECVELVVRLDNAKARRLYWALGFRPIANYSMVVMGIITPVMLMRLDAAQL